MDDESLKSQNNHWL